MPAENHHIFINGRNQTAGAAIFDGNTLLLAIREEYLSRIKNDAKEVPTLSLDYLRSSYPQIDAQTVHQVDTDQAPLSQHRAEAELAYACSGFAPNDRTLIAVTDLNSCESFGSYWVGYDGKLTLHACDSITNHCASSLAFIEKVFDEKIENLNSLTTLQKFTTQLCKQEFVAHFYSILQSCQAIDQQETTGTNQPVETRFNALIDDLIAAGTGAPVVLASAVQACINHIYHTYADTYRRFMVTTNCTHLCLAGNVALSAELNSYLLDSGLMSETTLAVTPFPCGIASYVGAGLAWLRNQNHDVPHLSEVSYSHSYSSEAVLASLEKSADLTFECIEDPSSLCDRVAQLIAAGKVIAWFQGGAELGPRALGNRTIISNFMDKNGAQKLNRAKQTKPTKECAIAITNEDARQVFANYHPSTHMQYSQMYTADFLAQHPWLHQATRPHAVTQSQNPLFWQLLNTIRDYTGIGAVYKSSLNISGLPPAENPSQAIEIFRALPDVDLLVIGSYLVARK